MKHRNSCRVVINPIFGNENIKQMLESRGTQLEKKRKMEEIVSQIEKDFEDLDAELQKKTSDSTPTPIPTKPHRLSSKSLEGHVAELRTSRGMAESRLSGKWLRYMRSSEVSKSVLSACSFDNIVV